MKYLLILVLLFSCADSIRAQSYSTEYTSSSGNNWVHISIDTNFSSTSILVEKVLVGNSFDTVVDQNTMILLGEFNFVTQATVDLNYSKYNYYWIPFSPSKPLYSIDEIIGFSVNSGTLTIGSDEISGPGDWVYWCSCCENCEPSDPSAEPGDCVSNLNMSNGSIRCVESGPGCPDGCSGHIVVGMGSPVLGGGVLIQVDSTKSRIVYNLDTD